MDDYRKKAAKSGEYARKRRKGAKGSAKAALKADDARVTRGSACVFCDIGLEPIQLRGVMFHRKTGPGYFKVRCPLDTRKPRYGP